MKNNQIAMPFLYFVLFLHITTFFWAQETAEAKVSHKILTAHERLARETDRLADIREQIRQSLPNQETLLEFDDFFSGLIKKDRNIKSLPKDVILQINSILPIDSLVRLVSAWQKLKLQHLRLIQHDLTKEYLSIPAFQDTSVIFQYLAFFDIQSGEKVAELGAGSGWLSLILSILYADTPFYINELGNYALQQARNNIMFELTESQLKQCYFAVGSTVSTGLEMENLNLIIAVDAFHHFTDKISMLKSIKWSLAKGGRLCLVEQVKTIDSGDNYCPQALEKWALEALLTQNGFVKNRERLLVSQKDRNIYMLEYVVNPL